MPRTTSTSTRRRASRSEEHTSELQSLAYLVCRLLLEKKKPTSAVVGRGQPLEGHLDVPPVDSPELRAVNELDLLRILPAAERLPANLHVQASGTGEH